MPRTPVPLARRQRSVDRAVTRAATRTLTALERLAGGLGTSVLALLVVVVCVLVALACLVGVGFVLVPATLSLVRTLADRERTRLGRWDQQVLSPGPLPAGVRGALGDRWVRREVVWAALHGTLGLLVSLVVLSMPLYAVRELSLPTWWWALPAGSASDQLGLFTVDGWRSALAVGAGAGSAWVAATVVLAPPVAWVQTLPGRYLLGPPAGTDLSLRVVELTATRAAALDAHAAELRRIERSLHDGTQNRLVAVAVLVGAARRALRNDPAAADAALGRAQDAAETALAELRAVVRSILPPVLADRGLAGALNALAAASPVPTAVEVDVPRGPVSVESTAYFVVAEALTNVARHAGAGTARVEVVRRGSALVVRVSDDGRGGADVADGSGLAGMEQRVRAHDGRLVVTSPVGGPTVVEAELPGGW